MSAPAISAILEGARYQFRFFWRQALPMLYGDPPLVERVVMEHRDISVVDDVVVYYAPPGVADRGRHVRIDLYQVKFHLAQAHCIRSSDLTDPAFCGNRNSLLYRFASAWRELRGSEPGTRLNLVTNWSWDPADPLASLIRQDGVMGDGFFTSSEKSGVGEVRRAWAEHVGLEGADLREFISDLRLGVQGLSQVDAGGWLIDRCSLAGLKAPDPSVSHSAYDDLAGRLLADGRREFTRAELAELVRQEKLIATAAQPFSSTCAIRSFARFAHVPETDAKVVVDLTDLFVGRHPIREDVWSHEVALRLQESLSEISSLPRPVQLALDTHTSIAWLVGTLLDAKAGLEVVLRQKSRAGVASWSTTTAVGGDLPGWQIEEESLGSGGAEVAVAVSVTHDILDDVRASIATLALPCGALAHVSLPQPGATAIEGGSHACALADDLVRRLRVLPSLRAAGRVHIFAACPVAFAFLLGQRSAALGPITMYEFDFGGSRRYSAATST